MISRGTKLSPHTCTCDDSPACIEHFASYANVSAFRAQLEAAGWYVRGRKTLCPYHKPKPIKVISMGD